jgi:hypothetical protein
MAFGAGPITVDEVGVLLYQIPQFLKTCGQRIGFAALLFGLALLPWPVTTARVVRHKPAVIILCPRVTRPRSDWRNPYNRAYRHGHIASVRLSTCSITISL